MSLKVNNKITLQKASTNTNTNTNINIYGHLNINSNLSSQKNNKKSYSNNKYSFQPFNSNQSTIMNTIIPNKTFSMTKRQFLVPIGIINPYIKQHHNHNHHQQQQFYHINNNNPYLKKFNVRRLTHTQQSRQNSKEKYHQYNNNNNNELIKSSNGHSLNIKNIKQKSNSSNHTNTNININIGGGSLQLKKTTKLVSNIRNQTQKLVNSPYRLIKQHIYTSDPTQENSLEDVHQNISKQKQPQKQKNFSRFTTFQKQQSQRYDILYPGKRRIFGLKDFTDVNGDAKVHTGDQIGYRYQIKSILGKGSFGQVFKAFDHKKKQLIAIKIIRNHPKFTAQAKVQIKILQQVIIKDTKFKCNIVQLKHGFFFRGHPCLVFQLLHINLYQFIKSYNFSGLSLEIIRRIGIQILQGLQFFKKHDIIHCDLKPQNILLKQQNKTGIKIIDLGSGCYQSQQIYTYIQSRFYRAPEIIIGINYTPAIDIWSFGCILCELFTGYPIFPGQSQHQQMLMFMEVLGKPSMRLIQKGNRSYKFFNGNQPILKPNSKGKVRKPSTKNLTRILNSDDTKFVSMIQMCFKWDPEQRITPNQALLHPWIVQGLPQEIQKQHVSQAIKDSKLDDFN